MGATIIAIALLSTILLVFFLRTKNYFFATIFGKKYIRQCEMISSKIDTVQSVNGNYGVICPLDEERSVIIPIEKRDVDFLIKAMDVSSQVSLLKDESKDCTCYQLWAVVCGRESNHQVNAQPYEFLDERGMCVISKILNTAKVIRTVLISASLIFAYVQPEFSIIFSGLLLIIYLFCAPFGDCKRDKKLCIMKEKPAHHREKHPQGDSTVTTPPPGYEEWSKIEKYLYGLDRQIQGFKPDETEAAALRTEDSENDEERAPAAKQHDNVNPERVDRSKENVQAPYCCKTCGCIIDQSDSFCRFCGARQAEQALNHEQEMPYLGEVDIPPLCVNVDDIDSFTAMEIENASLPLIESSDGVPDEVFEALDKVFDVSYLNDVKSGESCKPRRKKNAVAASDLDEAILYVLDKPELA